MQQENDDNTTTESTEAKPTITIAEKQGSGTTDAVKPTITIAERDEEDENSVTAKPTITIAEREGGE
ncbi:MAG TPA: hypothetical protein VNA22_03160 [Pyrinomonadaceae bacterium]|nr:hypothetical protein [Pyrinomonadaceae bacterium]